MEGTLTLHTPVSFNAAVPLNQQASELNHDALHRDCPAMTSGRELNFTDTGRNCSLLSLFYLPYPFGRLHLPLRPSLSTCQTLQSLLGLHVSFPHWQSSLQPAIICDGSSSVDLVVFGIRLPWLRCQMCPSRCVDSECWAIRGFEGY